MSPGRQTNPQIRTPPSNIIPILPHEPLSITLLSKAHFKRFDHLRNKDLRLHQRKCFACTSIISHAKRDECSFVKNERGISGPSLWKKFIWGNEIAGIVLDGVGGNGDDCVCWYRVMAYSGRRRRDGRIPRETCRDWRV